MRLIDDVVETGISKHEKFKHFFLANDDQQGTILNEMKECFEWICENRRKPYLTTYGELKDKHLVGAGSYNYSHLVDYATYLIKGIVSDVPNLTKDNGHLLEGEFYNHFYHACKISWLISQERTVGLYSTLQSKMTKENQIFFHPGMSRVHAYLQMEALDKKVIVWDNYNKFDTEPLSFDQWMDVFSNTQRDKFGANVDGEILEMHVGEERSDLIATMSSMRDMYKRELPVLKGKCDDEITEYFRTEGEGVTVETKNDYVFQKQDLRYFLELFPATQHIVEHESFTIRRD